MKQSHALFLRGALVVFVFNVLQKILAFAQQVLFARTMGLTGEADAFSLAQILPNLVGVMLAISAATVVAGLAAEAGSGPDAGRRRGLLGCLVALVVAAAACAAVAFFWSSEIAALLAPGSSAITRELTARLLRAMCPLLFLMPASGILCGLQQAEQQFLWVSLSWLLPVSGSIAGVAGYSVSGAHAIVTGWVLGGALQLVLLIVTTSAGWKIRPAWSGQAFSQFALRLASVLAVAASTTIYLVLDRADASRLTTGLPAAFALAGTLFTVPSQLVSFSVNSSLLPALIPLLGEPSRFARLWRNSSLAATAIVAPAILLFTLAPTPLLRMVFLSRHFSAGAVGTTAFVLARYGPAMLGLLARDCCIPALLALGCERAIIGISAAGFAVNLGIKYFASIDGNPAVIAYGTGAGLLSCGVGLLAYLGTKVPVFERDDFSFLRAVLGASAVAAAGGYAMRVWCSGIPARETILMVSVPALYILTMVAAFPPLYPSRVWVRFFPGSHPKTAAVVAPFTFPGDKP